MSVRFSRRTLLHTGLVAAGGRLALETHSAAAETREEPRVPGLKITAVKTYLLRHSLKRPFGVSVSVPLDTTRTTLLVKIETDAGLTGWGETAPIAGARGAIEDELGPRLVGRNPTEYRRLWRELWGANFGHPLAVGALDLALNDVRGKALNLPVAELFGGRLRSQVPAYASAMNYQDGLRPEDQYPQEAEALVKQGFQALKMRLGRYEVDREAAVAAAVREVVGPKVKLMVDGNAGYTWASALRMAKVLHELGFEFFEEPLPQSPRYAGYEKLREKMPLSLAGGEVVESRIAAKDLIDRHAFDIIQPDVSLCGGMGEALFIAELAALAGLRFIPHCWGSAIVIAATVQLVSLLPDPHWGLPHDTPWLEFDQSENPWRTEIVREPFRQRDGFVAVPTTPGLGIEIDETAVKRYAVNA